MINRIKIIKKRAGFTNKSLSDKSGVPLGTVNRVLGGQSKEPHLPTVARLSEALGASVNYVMYGEVGQDIPPNDDQRITTAYANAPKREQEIVDFILEPYAEGGPSILKIPRADENVTVFKVAKDSNDPDAEMGIEIITGEKAKEMRDKLYGAEDQKVTREEDL